MKTKTVKLESFGFSIKYCEQIDNETFLLRENLFAKIQMTFTESPKIFEVY